VSQSDYIRTLKKTVLDNKIDCISNTNKHPVIYNTSIMAAEKAFQKKSNWH